MNKFLITLIFLSSFALADEYLDTTTIYFDNTDIIKVHKIYFNKTKPYKFIRYHMNGQVDMVKTFDINVEKDFVLTNVKVYSPEGILTQETPFKFGCISGVEKLYYESGEIYEINIYANRGQHISTTRFYRSGEIAFIEAFEIDEI